MPDFMSFIQFDLFTLPVVAGLIVLFTLIAFYLLWRRFKPKISGAKPKADLPLAFGENMSWLTVSGTDPREVAGVLGLENSTPANWETGLQLAYDQHDHMSDVFISPPIDGWMFVVGRGLPRPQMAEHGDEVGPLLRYLSQQMSHCQAFYSFPGIELYGWSKAIGGDMMRAYAWQERQLIIDDGTSREAEQALGLKLFDPACPGAREPAYWQRADLRMPDESAVQAIAGQWSVNPKSLATLKSRKATGLVASLPKRWPF